MANKNYDFTKRLQIAIKSMGLSNKEFSKKSGISYSTLMTYLNKENLGRVPEWPQLLSISENTGRSIEWLLTGKNADEGQNSPEWTISPEARDRYKYLQKLISEINEAAKKEYTGIELGEILIETLRISIKKLEFEKKSQKKDSANNSG